MRIIFSDWVIALDKGRLPRQYDDGEPLEVVNAPDGWAWTLNAKMGDSLDVIPLAATDGVVGTTLSKSQLALAGDYRLQLVGTKDGVTRHTNIIGMAVPVSLSGDATWPTLPTAFSDALDRADAAADRAESAATHGPRISGTNTWYVWDPDKGYYIDTMVDASGAPGPKGEDGKDGTDGKDGADGLTPTIGDNGNWYLGTTDTGKPSRGETGETGPKGETGPQGPQGETGPQGPQGETGPQGPKGDQGEQGQRGETGATGATPDIQIGTVTTLEPGEDATASIGGTVAEPVLDLGIPKGAKGDKGDGGTVKTVLADFTLAEDLTGYSQVSVTLSDDPFKFSQILISITAQLADDVGQYQGWLYGDHVETTVFHLNTKFSKTKEKTWNILANIFETKVFAIASESTDGYMWTNGTHFSFTYPKKTGESQKNRLNIGNMSAKAGMRVVVEGI